MVTVAVSAPAEAAYQSSALVAMVTVKVSSPSSRSVSLRIGTVRAAVRWPAGTVTVAGTVPTSAVVAWPAPAA